MTESKEVRLAHDIYAQIGGKENVDKIIHCMTRVRISINDYSKVDIDALKNVPGVLGVIEDDTLQVVVGPGTVNKVAAEMVREAGVKLGEPFSRKNKSNKEMVEERAKEMQAATKAKQKKSKLRSVLKTIANIFVPLIPAFVGAGLIGGIASVLTNLQTAGDIGDSWTQLILILNVIKNALFAYLSIYVGINAANEFGATPGLGGIIGGTILLTGMTPEAPITNIFNGDPLVANQGGIIGVLIGVWVLSIVERNVRKIVPNSIDIIVTPTITLLIVGLLTIFIIMPFAGVVSSGLVGVITSVLDIGGPFAGFVLGACFLPMVMLGLHQVLTPIHIEMITTTGVTLLLPVLAMAGAGQVGAAVALWIKCRRNKQLTNMIKGALPVGFLGIGEPLIYGVTLPLGKPFFTACLGGGVGGAVIAGIGGIGAQAIGPSGVSLIPLINSGHVVHYMLGLVAAYIGGFVFTYLFGTPKSAMEPTTLEGDVQLEK